MTRREWKKANGYDIFIASCRVCRYFKKNKYLGNNYGNCRLLEQESVATGQEDSIVAYTACCQRFEDRYINGCFPEPTPLSAFMVYEMSLASS